MDDEALALRLAALGSPIRLSLFRRLVELGPRGTGPTALSEHVGLPRNLVSYHLKPLLLAGLVRNDRRGRDVVYSVDEEGLAAFTGSIESLSPTLD